MSKISPLKSLSTITALCISACLLQGCGQEIDYRQTQRVNGLLYKLNDDEPYTGKVSNMMVLGVLETGNCTIKFKKGLMDGTAICKSPDGTKVSETDFAAGAKDGTEKRWDGSSGKLILSMGWKGGRPDGKREVFNSVNGNTISKSNWVNGQKDGEEKGWDGKGEILLIDLDWKDGKQTGVAKDFNDAPQFGVGIVGEKNYKNGMLHGIFKTYLIANEVGMPQKYYLNEQGNYLEGKKEGIQQTFDAKGNVTKETTYKSGEIISVNSPVPAASATNANAPSPAIETSNPEISSLATKQQAADGHCKMMDLNDADTKTACDQRDVLGKELQSKGWCFNTSEQEWAACR